MSEQPRSPSTNSPATFDAGDYDFDGVSFTLPNPLISSSHHSISGYATTSSILAVISETLPIRTIFIDAATQDLLEIDNVLTTDKDVVFYNVTIQHPFQVFANLRMRTTASDVSCSAGFGSYGQAECAKLLLVNWDKNEDKAKLKEVLTGLSVYQGARVRVLVSFDFFCRGIKHLGLDYAFVFNGTAGAGIRLEKGVVKEFETEPASCYDVYAKSVNIGLLSLGATVQACFGVTIKRVDLQLPKTISYYRTWLLIAQSQGSISTTGIDASPFGFDLTSNRNSDFDAQELFDVVSDLKLNLAPQVEGYIQIKIQVGEGFQYSVRVGVSLRSEWTFETNVDKCPCPYLYGGVTSGLYGFYSVPVLKVLNVELIPEYSYEFPIFAGLLTDRHCIFSPKRSREGLSALVQSQYLPSYIFSQFEFKTSKAVGDLFPALQSVDANNKVSQDFPFEPIVWSQDLVARNQGTQVARTVIIRLGVGDRVRWHGSKEVFFIPRSSDFDADLEPGGRQGRWSEIDTDVFYTVARAQSVEIFKEFTGTDRQYVSFKPAVPEGSVLGAIIHSVNGKEYQSPELAAVVDDKGKSSSKLDFTAKAEVQVSLLSFKLLQNDSGFARMEFFSGDTELSVVTTGKLSSGVSVSGESLGFGGFDVDLTGKPRLALRVGLAAKEDAAKGSSTSEVKLRYEELSTGDNFTITKSNSIFEAEFRIVRTQPNVVFKFPNKLSSDTRVIICRIIQVEGTIPLSIDLPAAEGYGIVRFAGLEYPVGGNVNVLVSMPGLTPLCTHRVLDSGDFLIPVKTDSTLVGPFLHVPFRRDIGSWSGKISVLGVFKSTADATCRNGVEIAAPGSNLFIGCLEPVVFNDTMSEGWVSLPSPSSPRAIKLMGNTVPDRGRIVKTATFNLHLYASKKPSQLTVYPSVFEIPRNSVFLALEADSVAPFSFNDANVTVQCSRADFVLWECGQISPTKSGFLTPDPDRPGWFTGVPACRGSGLQFIAQCRNSNKAFCEFTLSVPQVSLLRYGTFAGLNEIASTVATGKFLPGVTRQIIRRDTPGRVFKNWEGPVEIIPIKNGGVLKLTATKRDGSVELSLALDGLDIPFSIEKYYNNPNGFFGNLSIKKAANGYPPDVAYLTDRGNVLINEKNFDEDAVRSGIIVRHLIDLPEKFIVSQAYGISLPPPKSIPPNRGALRTSQAAKGKLKLSTGLIVGIALGGFAVVVLLGVLVFLVLRKGKGKVNSSTSGGEKPVDNSHPEEPAANK